MTWIVIAAVVGACAGWAWERSVREVREDRIREELWELLAHTDTLRRRLTVVQDPLAPMAAGCQHRVSMLLNYLEGGSPRGTELVEEDPNV